MGHVSCECMCDLFSSEDNVAVVDIVSLNPPNVCGFLEKLLPGCDGDISKDDQVSAFVGQRKEQVDPVDANLPKADVIRVFGVKFGVSGRPDAIAMKNFTIYIL